MKPGTYMKAKRGAALTKATALLTAFALTLLSSVFGAGAYFTDGITFSDPPYEAGETVIFGSYPGSRVSNDDLVAKLGAAAGEWTSYGFYTGTGKLADGRMAPKDYAEYCDVEYPAGSGYRYRGVRMTGYRPYWTGYSTKAENSYQDDNGYLTGTTYWFAWEPLRWVMLDPSTGLMVTEKIIDSGAFNNVLYADGGSGEKVTYYNSDAPGAPLACAYSASSLRSALTDESDPASFYNTAFTEDEQALLITAGLNNSGYYTLQNEPGHEELDDVDTNDKVFALANDEMAIVEQLSSGNDIRLPDNTDYAECMGLNKGSGGKAGYRLRSPGAHSYYACNINVGSSGSDTASVNNTSVGIRPAVKLDMDSAGSARKVSVTFTLDGGVLAARAFLPGDDMKTPAAPVKAGYTFTDWDPTLPRKVGKSSVEYSAVMKQDVYYARLMVDGELYDEIPYVYGQKSIQLPKVPKKEHYDGAWESYSLTPGGIVINAVYTPHKYAATFVADGSVVEVVYFIFEQESIKTPEVPDKPGYDGEWESFILTGSDLTINAVYTPKKYVATLVADGVTVKEISYTYGQKSIPLPPVPEKEGFEGEWERYTLGIGGVTINAIYTPKNRVASVKPDDLQLRYLARGKIDPKVSLTGPVSYKCVFTSSDPSVITVDEAGNYKATGRGTATVTVSVTDANGITVKGSCTVTVRYTFWQWLIIIFLFGFIWYK